MILDIIQIISAILLTAAILMQNRGSGLGSAFGGGDAVYSTRRHLEKQLFYFTIVMAVIFLGVTLINIIY